MFKKHLSLFSGLMLVLILSISSCKSSYEKLKASNDNSRKFQEGIKLYNKKEYTKALGLFDDVAPKYKGQSTATELFYYQAMANYKLKDYASAAYLFKQFADTFPSDPKAEECRFLTAYCYYLDSPNFTLDQENTQKAIERLQFFINLYHNSEKVAEANKLVQTLHERLESPFEPSPPEALVESNTERERELNLCEFMDIKLIGMTIEYEGGGTHHLMRAVSSHKTGKEPVISSSAYRPVLPKPLNRGQRSTT